MKSLQEQLKEERATMTQLEQKLEEVTNMSKTVSTCLYLYSEISWQQRRNSKQRPLTQTQMIDHENGFMKSVLS